MERARDQGTALRAHDALGPEPPADWAGQIAQETLVGAGFVEIAFHHAASRTLVLCDTVQALEPARLPLPMGLLVRALGAAGPAGGTPRHVRLVLARHRDHNREAVRHLLARDPMRVIFAHGAWFESDGAARLRRAFAWLLGIARALPDHACGSRAAGSVRDGPRARRILRHAHAVLLAGDVRPRRQQPLWAEGLRLPEALPGALPA
ncbi:hypothetical protein [Dankookia sp. P2]|uniref:hypothetical protein n=1 Tax=Dankookia sp. P2 TaxID=3423955 RepID=UPI003D66DDA1